ncbi:hypothetical protein GCM10011384_00070 [Psychrobacillus lasiicapitis]|nr:hypothetical protein GCM10011384_00070 [Psychrobacillus lasiicapitis]
MKGLLIFNMYFSHASLLSVYISIDYRKERSDRYSFFSSSLKQLLLKNIYDGRLNNI